ncbi:MAG: succinate dehydrogenase [Armatimonadetes bacterium]|nr:succinate dehydrogenase [Armatimonadota bacterium]
MAGRESFFWHKLHSLTGVIPTGFYLVQHLTLNSFALAGAEKFDGVINFFEGMPKHFLYFLKFGVIWPALIFHAVYGIFIISRSEGNYSQESFKYRENKYYTLQRWSGIFAFFFLAYHMATTSVLGTIKGAEVIYYDTWAERLASGGTYLVLAFYVLGVLASAYHFAYGLWNFGIRWGITISDSAQKKSARFSQLVFVGVSAIGILALVGFFNPVLKADHHGGHSEKSVVSTPISTER